MRGGVSPDSARRPIRPGELLVLVLVGAALLVYERRGLHRLSGEVVVSRLGFRLYPRNVIGTPVSILVTALSNLSLRRR